jgi:hypothetical protein
MRRTRCEQLERSYPIYQALLLALLRLSVGVAQGRQQTWTNCQDINSTIGVDCCNQCPDCPNQHGETGDLRPGYRCTTRSNVTGSCPGQPRCELPLNRVKSEVACVPQFECGYTSPGRINRRNGDGTPWSEQNQGGPGLI